MESSTSLGDYYVEGSKLVIEEQFTSLAEGSLLKVY